MAGKGRMGARGFTLIEVIIVLAILSVILGMLAPMAFQLFSSERASALEQELQQIYTAIIGDPAKGIYGYVGDVGNYPANLIDLVQRPVVDGQPIAGWKGPYVQNARIENGVWLDPFGRPYEFYVVNGTGTSDELAVVSRGPDGASTNPSVTPNIASTYDGLSPAEDGYAAQTANKDNVGFPRVEGNVNALSVKTDGDVAFNILNWDNNKEVNTFVPACPGLYTLTATSVARGAEEAKLVYNQGLAFNLAQGQYRVTIVPQGLTTTAWAETITVQPGTTLTRTLNLTGLDSSGTPQFNLTVKNGFSATDLEVFQFDTKLANGYLPGQSTNPKSYVDNGETRVFAVKACSQVYVRKKSESTVVDQFVMPYGAFTRQEGTSAATLLITNLCCHTHHDHGNGKIHHHHDEGNHYAWGHHRVFIYRNDILMGTVNHHHKAKEFKDLLAGDVIKIYDKFGTLLTTLTLVTGTNSVTLNG